MSRTEVRLQSDTAQSNRLNGGRARRASDRSRIFKIRGNQHRLQVMLDVYNALNKSAVIAYDNTFGPEWQRPTDVLQGRLVKIGGQFTF